MSKEFVESDTPGGALRQGRCDVDRIELEINKERACCRDVLVAIDKHLDGEQYDTARDRVNDLQKSINYIEVLESNLKERNRSESFKVSRGANRNGRKEKVVSLDVARKRRGMVE